MYSVKHRMSSIESALFIHDLFDRVYHSELGKTHVDTVFESDMYRESEAIDDFSMYDTMLNDYIEYDLNKLFGMSLSDYMGLTMCEKERIIKISRDKAIQALETQRRVKEEMDNLTKSGKA